jgi:para-aminobenzoate synthetase component 1
LKRFSKSYSIINKDEFVEKIIQFSSVKNNFVLLNSNDYSDEYDLIVAYGIESSIKSSKNSLIKLDNYIDSVDDWVFGYLSYDLKNEIEDLNDKNEDIFNLPNINFFQPKVIWLIKNGTATILSLNKKNLIDDWVQINSLNCLETLTKSKINLKSRGSKDDYIIKINGIKERILKGDCYEMNFCFDMYCKNNTIDPYQTYIKLNNYTRSPMSTFLKLDNLYLMSSSPERFIKKENKKIISQPIKGTAKRGLDSHEDKEITNKLLSDPKELSENHMIVDLVRNDLSRIAEKGSVRVKKLNKLNTFKRVHQLISTIEANIQSNIEFSKIIEGTFPMGSMTGAPKIKSMNIIDEYESVKRGLYSGSVGYIKPNKDFDFNVIIRSIIYDRSLKEINVSVGSAITFKSDPESEYDECLIKAEPMIRSLK